MLTRNGGGSVQLRTIALLMFLVMMGNTRSLVAQADRKGPSVRVGGTVYGQYQYFLRDAADDANNFDIARAYINVLGDLGHNVTSRVTADIYRNTDGSLAYRLKYAYAALGLGDSPFSVKLGQIQTPWVEFEEALWDYRMQGTTALDRNGYLTSSDFGLGLDGSFADGDVTFQSGVYNGEGYQRTPGDKRKDVAARLSFRVLDTDETSRTGGLQLSAFGHAGKPTGGGVRERALGMVSYRSKLLTLAVEGVLTRDRSDEGLPPSDPIVEGRVITAFTVLRIPNTPVAIIGRVDDVNPDTDVADDRRTRIIAGASYQVSPNLRLLADIDHVTFEGGAPSPAVEASSSQALFQIGLTF
jgi:hypothetical protein